MTELKPKKRFPTPLRWTLGILVALTIFIFGFYAYVRSAGESAWEEAVAYYESKGGSLDFEALLSAPIPEDENFASIPELRGITVPEDNPHPDAAAGVAARATIASAMNLIDSGRNSFAEKGIQAFGTGHISGHKIDIATWARALADHENPPASKDTATAPDADKTAPPPDVDPGKIAADADLILSVLDSHLAPLFTATDDAVSRPHSQWIPSPGTMVDRNFIVGMILIHANTAIDLSQILGLRASAAIYAGKSKIAADSILAILHFAGAESPPEIALTPTLVAVTERQFAFAALSEALGNRTFDTPELEQIQARLAEIDTISDLEISFRGEVVTMCQALVAAKDPGVISDMLNSQSSTFDFYPSGWVDLSRAAILRRTYDHIIAPLAARDLAELKTQSAELEAWIGEKRGGSIDRFRYFLFILTMPIYSTTGALCAHSQAVANQAQIACALERYFLRHEAYPTSLEPLVPEFLKTIPEDPMDRKPMRYRQTPDGRYLLYSIGWNGIDEDATPAWRDPAKAQIHREEGDWVWSYRDLRPKS